LTPTCIKLFPNPRPISNSPGARGLKVAIYPSPTRPSGVLCVLAPWRDSFSGHSPKTLYLQSPQQKPRGRPFPYGPLKSGGTKAKENQSSSYPRPIREIRGSNPQPTHSKQNFQDRPRRNHPSLNPACHRIHRLPTRPRVARHSRHQNLTYRTHSKRLNNPEPPIARQSSVILWMRGGRPRRLSAFKIVHNLQQLEEARLT
jgi:hypothetical protein